MYYLLLVSIVWGFSFGLIKGQLTGLDSNFVAVARLFLSFMIFLPFLRLQKIKRQMAGQFLLIGAIQFGLMYMSYIYSYQFLLSYQVALFTIFTPLYVTLLDDLLRRRFQPVFFITALLAIIGSGVIVYQQIEQAQLLQGFLLIQFSNMCFALGQIYYKKMMIQNSAVKEHSAFGLLYIGALLITAPAALVTTDWAALNLSFIQILTLLYLGIIASGLCFFLWNFGATRTNTGALAIFNNVKIPIGMALSLFVFGESGNLLRLISGGALIAFSLYLNEWQMRSRHSALPDY